MNDMKFSIDSCEYKGCMYNETGMCCLNTYPVNYFLAVFIFLSINPSCKAAKQIKIYKTKELINL